MGLKSSAKAGVSQLEEFLNVKMNYDEILAALDEKGIKNITRIEITPDGMLKVYSENGTLKFKIVEDVVIKGTGNLDGLFLTVKNLDEAKIAVRDIDLPNLSTTNLNKLLKNSDEISSLTANEIASLKSDIIKNAGFTNFNRKGISEEVKGFVDMDVNVVVLDEPLILYR